MATSNPVLVVGKVVQVAGPAVDCAFLEAQIPLIYTAIRITSEGFDPLDPDRKSTRLNSSHLVISYAVFCLKKKKKTSNDENSNRQTHEHNSVTRRRQTE